jgi:flagellar biosynthesis/type III secretory pathway protein FliH
VDFPQGKLAIAWLRFLRETGDVDTIEEAEVLEREIASAAPELQEAVALAREAGFSPTELEAYDRYWDAVRTERTLIEGKAAEAKAEGLAAGRAVGIEEGRELERHQLVLRLVAKGLTEAEARALLDA